MVRQSHGPHQAPDPLPVYPVTVPGQLHLHAPRPVEGGIQVLLVDLLHEGQVLPGRAFALVIGTGSVDAQ